MGISIVEMIRHEPAIVFAWIMGILALLYFLVYLPFLRDRFTTLKTLIFYALLFVVLGFTSLYFLHLFGYVAFDPMTVIEDKF